MQPSEYHPIDCSLHDELEAAATRGRPATLVYTEGEVRHTVDEIIVDVFSRAGAEFLRTGSGLEIRLDSVESMNGVIFRNKD